MDHPAPSDSPHSGAPAWPDLEDSAAALEARLCDAVSRFLSGAQDDTAREFREMANAYAPLKSAIAVRKSIDKRHDELADRAERAALRARAAAQASESPAAQPAFVSIDRRAIDTLKGEDAAHDGSDRFCTADLADLHRIDPLGADEPFPGDLDDDPDADEDDPSVDFDLEDPDAGDSGLD